MSTYLLRQSLLWAFDHCRRRLFTLRSGLAPLFLDVGVRFGYCCACLFWLASSTPVSRPQVPKTLAGITLPHPRNNSSSEQNNGFFFTHYLRHMVLFSDLSLDRCQVWPVGGARGVDHGVRAAPGVLGVQPRPGGRVRGGPAAPDPQKTSRMGFLRCLLLDCSAAV